MHYFSIPTNDFCRVYLANLKLCSVVISFTLPLIANYTKTFTCTRYCIYVNFVVIWSSRLIYRWSPEKDCCWLWLTFQQPVLKPSSSAVTDISTTCVEVIFTPDKTFTLVVKTLGHNQQQSFSGLHQRGWSTNHKHWFIWVTTNNNTSQDYTNLDDQPATNIDSPGFRPFTVHIRVVILLCHIVQLQARLSLQALPNYKIHDCAEMLCVYC